METIIMVAQLLLGLSILVGLHEGGHMLAAKAFGMRVEKFYIGFPPKIIGRKWGETEYAFGAIPLGGFVKITGMIDESLDTNKLSEEPEPWEFRAKPAWQRLIVMLGGIIVNVITGIIVFIAITFVNGEQYLPKDSLNKYGIVAEEIGQEIGLQTGDRILKINGEDYSKYEDIMAPDVLVGTDVYFTVGRGNEQVRIDVPNDFMDRLSDKQERARVISPRIKFTVAEVQAETAKEAGLLEGDKIVEVNGSEIAFYDELKEALLPLNGEVAQVKVSRESGEEVLNIPVSEDGKLGFVADFSEHTDLYVRNKLSFGQSVVTGTNTAFGIVFLNIKGFRKMFSGDVSVRKSLSGPIGIATMFGGTWDWGRFWYLVGLLSMVLAFMNLLPIPALDGGHVVFLTWEIVTGRKPGDKFMEYAQKVGMILLLALMVFVIGNDILKLFQ